jgi:DNA-binding transcriptional ArsR family regulator
MTVDTEPRANGHHPPVLADDDLHTAARRLEDTIADRCAELRDVLEAERALRARVESIVDESKAREKRIQRALAALGEPEEEPVRRQTAAKPQKPSARKQYASAEAISRVFGAMVEANAELRQKDLSDATGLSHPTIAKSLTVLREQEKVRITRQDHTGRYFALMPGATEA